MEVGDSVLEALIKSVRKTIVPSLKPTIAKDILEHRLNAIIQKAKEVVLEKIIFCLLFFDDLAVKSPLKAQRKGRLLIWGSNCVGVWLNVSPPLTHVNVLCSFITLSIEL